MVPQCGSDRQTFTFVGDIADDTQKIANVDTFGRGARVALAGEYGDTIGNVVESIAGDRGLKNTGGVAELEPCERVVEVRSFDWVLPRALRLFGRDLLVEARLQSRPGVLDLRRGGLGVVIQFNA